MLKYMKEMAKKRDSSYHQGITWPWLLGLYYNALKKHIEKKQRKKDAKKRTRDKIRKVYRKNFKNVPKRDKS